MKLRTYIILLTFMPGLASAQDKALAPESQTDRYQQIAYAAPADSSIIELYALVARKKFTADPNLYAEVKQTDRSEAGIIDDWRERVFKTVGMFSLPRQTDLLNDNRLQSNNEIADQASAGRLVTRMVLKETLKFTQERLPEIEKLVKALKFEVSTDMISGENAGTDATDGKDGEAPAVHNTMVKDKLLLRTGLRVPVESGKLGVTSETEARYGKVSSFFKMYLDGQYDNSVGLTYALGRDIHLQVERRVTHTTDLETSDQTNAKSNLNLIQLVCTF